MATLIEAGLFFLLAFQLYRDGRRLHADRSAGNPALSRLDDLPLPDLAAGAGTAEEAQERDLSRRLVAGRIDQATYRQQMSQLAHAAATPARTRP